MRQILRHTTLRKLRRTPIFLVIFGVIIISVMTLGVLSRFNVWTTTYTECTVTGKSASILDWNGDDEPDLIVDTTCGKFKIADAVVASGRFPTLGSFSDYRGIEESATYTITTEVIGSFFSGLAFFNAYPNAIKFERTN